MATLSRSLPGWPSSHLRESRAPAEHPRDIFRIETPSGLKTDVAQADHVRSWLLMEFRRYLDECGDQARRGLESVGASAMNAIGLQASSHVIVYLSTKS